MNHQAFWFNEALNIEAPSASKPLTHIQSADICIIGGGYTGLWSAIKIKQKSPNKHVVILEKGLCGQGASGRNGGCMLTFSTKFSSLIKYYGLTEAIRLVKASEQAVYDINAFCQHHNINADIRVDGAIYTATNSTQLNLLKAPLSVLEKHGINSWYSLENDHVKTLTGSAQNQAGIHSAAAGSLHPGKLVRGLKKTAEQLGVVIYEQSPMEHVEYGTKVKVSTPKGQVHCQKLILAINAWMPSQFKRFKNSVVLVSSDMMITEPMPQVLADNGLNHGMAIADSRIFVHYYRTTPDGRLMLGKGGNLFAYNNKMLPEFDQKSGFKAMLHSAKQRFFPNFPDNIHTTWTGASDRSATGLPFFGALPEQNNVFYGFGYSGNGVVQSFLGGEFLSSLVLDEDNEWTRSGMAKGPLGHFPPEPIRSLGAKLIRQSVLRKEKMEDEEQKPYWIDQQMAKFASSAGKADKHSS